jgi:hypothetical protein
VKLVSENVEDDPPWKVTVMVDGASACVSI